MINPWPWGLSFTFVPGFSCWLDAWRSYTEDIENAFLPKRLVECVEMGWSGYLSYALKFFVDQWSQSICATGSLTKWNKTIYFFTHLFTRIYFILIKRSQHLAHRRKCPHHSRQAGLQSRPNSPLVEARPELDQCCLYRHHHLQPATIRFWSCPFPRDFEGTLNLMDLKPPHRQTGEALWVKPENISYHSIQLVLNSSLFFGKMGFKMGLSLILQIAPWFT